MKNKIKIELRYESTHVSRDGYYLGYTDCVWNDNKKETCYRIYNFLSGHIDFETREKAIAYLCNADGKI